MSNIRQEVNLYLPHLRPQMDWLSPVNSLFAIGAAIIFLGLLVLLGWQQNTRLQSDIATIQQQMQSVEQQISVMSSKLPKSQARQLDRQIAEVRQQIVRRQRIKTLVESQNLGNADGFSSQMEGLARRLPAKLYLEGFRLEAGGGLVSLQGRTVKAQSVPLYIGQLQKEPAFTESRFGVMSIARNKNGAVHSFTVAPGETSETDRVKSLSSNDSLGHSDAAQSSAGESQ
jgi:Tfp pilus assembly protein PilN